MERNILKIVTENKKLFVPHLFTYRQINIMDKYLHHQILNNTERTYLYSTIKKKIDALRTLKEEFYINGSDMIPKRVEEAKNILKKINKEQAFISGSFLYKKDYEDIDIYVISKRRKSYHKENQHFTFITEKMLKNPIFFSSLKYSIANFSIDIKPEIKRPEFNDLIMTYEMAIGEFLGNDDLKMLRTLIFEYYIHMKNEILDSFTLFKKSQHIKKNKEKIKIVNLMTKELLLNIYSKKYLYAQLCPFLKDLKKMIKGKGVYDNIIIYLDLLTEVKNECRRT